MEREDTIFGKIIRREIPADIVFESDTVLAFRDIAPQAPVHILVIPKKPIRNISDADPAVDGPVLGELLLACHEIARAQALEQYGYRLVINNGVSAGQTVWHLHIHLLAGRSLQWPPG